MSSHCLTPPHPNDAIHFPKSGIVAVKKSARQEYCVTSNLIASRHGW